MHVKSSRICDSEDLFLMHNIQAWRGEKDKQRTDESAKYERAQLRKIPAIQHTRRPYDVILFSLKIYLSRYFFLTRAHFRFKVYV